MGRSNRGWGDSGAACLAQVAVGVVEVLDRGDVGARCDVERRLKPRLVAEDCDGRDSGRCSTQAGVGRCG